MAYVVCVINVECICGICSICGKCSVYMWLMHMFMIFLLNSFPMIICICVEMCGQLSVASDAWD